MKFSKSLLAVSMSAMMLFSAPVANAGILQCQTVEAAVSKTSSSVSEKYFLMFLVRKNFLQK